MIFLHQPVKYLWSHSSASDRNTEILRLGLLHSSCASAHLFVVLVREDPDSGVQSTQAACLAHGFGLFRLGDIWSKRMRNHLRGFQV